MESNLTVVGSSGIEDLLADKVPETIKALREAGIHIWLLTGDKTETAINVAHSCGLIDKEYRVIQIDALSRGEVLF